MKLFLSGINPSSVWLSAQQLHLASDKYSLTHDNQNISNECQFKIGIGGSEAGSNC